MIQDGCLNGVDEVYGFRSVADRSFGRTLVQRRGPVMSEGTTLEIKIIGTSGHGS